MDISDCFKIGYVSKTHGLQGGVTVVLGLECPSLTGLKTIYVGINGSLVPFFIVSRSVNGSKAFIKFEEVDTPEQAAKLKGCTLYLSKKDRPKLTKNEFYSEEVIGFEVVDSQKGRLGLVKEVHENGFSRHLIVLLEGKEVMIPTQGPFITRLVRSRKKVEVSLPDGFLDL